MESFGERLHRAVAERGPLCVGIDPHPALLARWGLPDDVAGWTGSAGRWSTPWPIGWRWSSPSRPSSSASGPAASGFLSQLSDSYAMAGALVLLDVKRGDIGSTVGRVRLRIP